MKQKELLVASAITAFLTLTADAAIASDQSKQTTEKCYGIVKAGMNDCATATASCAGSSTKDNQADAYIFLPKGICERLVGGRLTAEDKPDSSN
ncbi:DUF2282 domain-containing protein [Legionella jamestowniensis]|uniref:Signal peptidase n=1 Tax=Legionella jamestowniensis TaxID=455 RepID=A0A0W0UZL4_9GAMM|nr:DUF2282 domain-containing protein [Legionella jamestowniensis]KTD13292.1 signal peptide protein [Legionella jamestowniensis]OCH98320.1 signal peptidase [Legionella jamestowniensis]SFL77552.1 Uncharacterized membrane protein [Legionella jamestowniensis DSM 19215]